MIVSVGESPDVELFDTSLVRVASKWPAGTTRALPIAGRPKIRINGLWLLLWKGMISTAVAEVAVPGSMTDSARKSKNIKTVGVLTVA